MTKVDPKAILRDNVETLMRQWYGKVNKTQFGKDTGIATGGAQRALSGEVDVGVELVASIAKKARLQAWQLLVPDLNPLDPPRLGGAHAAREHGGEPLNIFEQQLLQFFRGMNNSHRDALMAIANGWYNQDDGDHVSVANPYPRKPKVKS